MDQKLRNLERQASAGDPEALHRLLAEHLRLGLLKPVDPGWAAYKKKQAQEAAKKMELRLRSRGEKRLTAKQRREKRQREKRKWRGIPKSVRK